MTVFPTVGAVVTTFGLGAVTVVLLATTVKTALPLTGPTLGLAVTGIPTAGDMATVVFGFGAAFTVTGATVTFIRVPTVGGTAIDMVDPFVL